MSEETMTKAEPGSVSWGTLKDEDLIESFLSELEYHNHPDYKSLRAEYDNFCYNQVQKKKDPFDDEWMGFFIWEDVFDAMQDLAPEGHYFGSHPGDGADFGFWSDEEEEEQYGNE